MKQHIVDLTRHPELLNSAVLKAETSTQNIHDLQTWAAQQYHQFTGELQLERSQ
jgi:hypothetical protein